MSPLLTSDPRRRKLEELLSETLRGFRIVLVERRLPGKCYQMYFSFLDRIGIRVATIKLNNGFRVKGYSHCFFMFYEIWSKRDYDFPGFSLAPGMTVVDIGANQGFFSLYAASKGAIVFAFEPCTDNWDILRQNVVTNNLENNIRIFNLAVTGEEGAVTLFVGLDRSGDVLSGSVSTCNANRGGVAVQARTVRSTTLDSLLSKYQIENCDFLKMDCEGAEYDILGSTSRASFCRISRISMECHQNRIQEAIDILEHAGFEILCATPGETGLLKAVNARSVIGLRSRINAEP
jgi:FkbM family methyltransferase